MAHKDLHGVLEKFGIGDERLLGAGGESRVYALSDDLVLRVYRGHAGRTIPERKALLAALPRDAVPFALPDIVGEGAVAGAAYTIERRLPGRSLDAALERLRSDTRADAWRNYLDAAEAIARLAIEGDWFGETTGWGGTPLRAHTWVGFLLAGIDRSLREMRDVLSRDVPHFDAALDRIRRRVIALGEPAKCVLVHGDFYPQNVMVDEAGCVTGVIDFGGNTLLGDQRMDLASAAMFVAIDEVPHADGHDAAFVMDEACRRYGAGFADIVEAYRGYYAIHFAGGPEQYAQCVATLRTIAA
jgi:aminoglycoside phosphotransferase (APT) family kinase protein